MKGAKKAKMVEEAFPENEDNEPAFDALMQLQKRWSAPPRPRRWLRASSASQAHFLMAQWMLSSEPRISFNSEF